MRDKFEDPAYRAQEIGNRIRLKRLALGFGQKTLAQLVGCKQSQVSVWEGGGSRPSEVYRGKLASHLKTSISYIMTGVDATNQPSAPQGAEEFASAVIINLPHVKDTYELYHIVSVQEKYDQIATRSIREQITQGCAPDRIHELSSRLIIEQWDNQKIAGILAVVLSSAARRGTWAPCSSVLEKLKELCLRNLCENNFNSVGIVEPLASAVGVQTDFAIYRKLLQAVVHSNEWRAADAARIALYYGSSGYQLGAIARHIRDPVRNQKVPLANKGISAVRLTNLIFRLPVGVLSSQTLSGLRTLREESLAGLAASGEQKLAAALVEKH